MKFIKAGYAFVLLLIVAATAFHYLLLAPDHPTPVLPIVAALLLLWPIERHIRRQTVKITLSGDKLRYETGLISKSTRIIQIPKIQDVRVNQSFWQRIFGVGDLSIETAGEHSRLVVEHLDRPQPLAEQLIDASSREPRDSGLHTGGPA